MKKIKFSYENNKSCFVLSFTTYREINKKLYKEPGMLTEELNLYRKFFYKVVAEHNGIRKLNKNLIPVAANDDNDFIEVDKLVDCDRERETQDEAETGYLLAGARYYTWVDAKHYRPDGSVYHDIVLAYGIRNPLEMVERVSLRVEDNKIIGYAIVPNNDYSYAFDETETYNKLCTLNDDLLMFVLSKTLRDGKFIKEDLYAKKIGVA